MGALPQVSGATLCKMLVNLGYSVVSQKGSHIKLKLICKKGTHIIIIPNHKTIAKGTLNDILTKVCLWVDKSKDELIEFLR
ncbi:MAG: type II toxin-antitoxin system HicA family toxin [Spirochaetales bacterium]|nr:type II toxin-antitoxin system HicA family toxin [Spirochaetales bacterium]